jgi:succinate dehydrogenase / fumarate reductase cytochrome b subunit
MAREVSLRQAGTHVGDALDAGADCLVTPCPLCHLNLDMQQPEAAKVVNRSSASRCSTCRSSSAWRSGSSPSSWG